MLVYRVDDPLGLGVATDSLVSSVDEDHFVEFESGILSNPI